ncbi:hypothetical protein A3I18_00285 [Candidatus Campbellbacteria bacterium RIFCSPLOWO2_02_FULL_35_11]|uniref:Uncharacterized protein n=1 Tax=Candidatus Campbellbacteria bacterium RIFCSPLOWO2_02_FULL_35_11 TaxID=1797581 RepID=A0A1F5ETG6_9BACT|nr:MAG: hypothetical protein A3I18_00285 [Candidatus Campbellbacteria bacterium RIFCSPLOWO2_02_FULL_35_11]
MRKDEFIRIHGEKAWNVFAGPLQRHPDMTIRSNANATADFRIKEFLIFLGFNERDVFDNKIGAESAKEIITKTISP